MNTAASRALAHATLLADRHKRLAGIAWRAMSSGADAPLDWLQGDGLRALDWLQGDGLRALAAELPCVVVDTEFDRWAAEAQDAASAAGLERVEASRIALADDSFPATLSLSQAWVAGRWYQQAPAKPNAAQTASRALALELVQLVANDADTRDLEDVFRRDAALSYHLLRLVNSPAIGSQRVVTSFSQAIMILGRQQLRRWLNLMLFAARQDDDRAPLLMAHVTLRSRAMELLAREAGFDRATQEMAFMTGMFSMLGTLFGLDTATVLQPLKLPSPMREALTDRGGELGQLLALMEAADAGDASAVHQALAALSLGAPAWHLALPQASLWTLDLTRANGGHGHA